MNPTDPINTAAAALLSAVAALGYPILATPSTQQQIDLARAAAALRLALYGPAPWPADEFVGCSTGG